MVKNMANFCENRKNHGIKSRARRPSGGGMGHSPPSALFRGRHFEGRKYGILKIGRFWQTN